MYKLLHIVRFLFYPFHTAYRYAQLKTKHILHWLFVSILSLHIILMCALIVLRYWVLPELPKHRTTIERLVSEATEKRVSIGRIEAYWQGVTPHLVLHQVIIRDKLSHAYVDIPHLSADWNWWRLLIGQVRLHQLQLEIPELVIQRTRDGWIWIGGFSFDPTKHSGGQGFDWLLTQTDVRVKIGQIRWYDHVHDIEPLIANQVQATLRNAYTRHHFVLKAEVLQVQPLPIDFRADFSHAILQKKISDFSRWRGTFYWAAQDVNLNFWHQYLRLYLPSSYQPNRLQGFGSLRTWFDFRDLQPLSITSDLSLRDLEWNQIFSEQTPLHFHLYQLQGRFILSRIYKETRDVFAQLKNEWRAWGKYPYQFAIEDMVLQPNQQQAFRPITATFAITEKNNLPLFVLQAQQFDVQILPFALAYLKPYFPINAQYESFLNAFDIKGELQNFSYQWQILNNKIDAYEISGYFSGLSLLLKPEKLVGSVVNTDELLRLPQFSNLSGFLRSNAKEGSLQIDSRQTRLYWPFYFANAFLLNQLNLNANWEWNQYGALKLSLPQLQIKHEGSEFLAKLNWQSASLLNKQQKIPAKIDAQLKIDQLNLKQIADFLPLQTHEHLRQWLTGALLGGTARDFIITVDGNPEELSALNSTSHQKKLASIQASAIVEDGVLDYAPLAQANERWPQINKIKGRVSYQQQGSKAQLRVDAQQASTSDVALNDVHVVIDDLLHEATLSAQGKAEGALQNMLHFVAESPVFHWLGGLTENWQAQGNANLSLNFSLPFADHEQTVVKGDLHFKNNQLKLFSSFPSFLLNSGQINFTQNSFNFDRMNLQLAGQPITLRGGMQNNGLMQIQANGILSVAQLRKQTNLPADWQKLAEYFQGSTPYQMQLTGQRGNPQLLFFSNLQGLTTHLPAPLTKDNPNQMLPLQIRWGYLPKEDKMALNENLRVDDLRIAMGNILAAHYQRERSISSAQRTTATRLLRGVITLGDVSTALPDQGLLATVQLRELNVDAWRNLFDRFDQAKNSTVASPGVNTRSNPSAIHEYIYPNQLAAYIEKARIFDKPIEKLVIGASRNGRLWQANINSAQASGYVAVDALPEQTEVNKITARLAYLFVPESATNDVQELFEQKAQSFRIPEIDLSVDNFQLFGKSLGVLQISAKNQNQSNQANWLIQKLHLKNEDADFDATGQWSPSISRTQLKYKLQISDAGQLLERLGFAGLLKDGKGNIEGDLSWHGVPYRFDIPSLNGDLQLSATKGQFTKVQSSITNLLGVLSLQSLPRRFTLDFRDVFSSGFAFDSVAGTAKINNGVLQTDNLKMLGVNASVLMDGNVDLTQRAQNLHVMVIPEINAGSASVVYGIAVNPVIGLGSFLAQLVLRDPLRKILTFEYQISGSWQEPNIQKLKEEKNTKL